MTKFKKLLFITLILSVLFILLFACFVAGVKQAYAEECVVFNTAYEDGDDSIQPYAFETLNVSIGGGGGKVWVTAKNKFQVGHSTVTVYIKLYYSYSYCEDYSRMTLASSNYIDDLDSGKSISAEASTGGEERYWLGLLQYRVNSGALKEKTVTARCSASGDFIGKN